MPKVRTQIRGIKDAKKSNKFAMGGPTKKPTKKLRYKIDLDNYTPLLPLDAKTDTFNAYIANKKKPKKTLEQKKKDVEDYSKNKIDIANSRFNPRKEADFNGKRRHWSDGPYTPRDKVKWLKHDDKMSGRLADGGSLKSAGKKFKCGGKLSKKC